MKRIYFPALFSVDGIKIFLSWQEICARSKVNPRKVKKPSIQKWCFVPGQNNSLECSQDQDCSPGTICTQGTCLEGNSSVQSVNQKLSQTSAFQVSLTIRNCRLPRRQRLRARVHLLPVALPGRGGQGAAGLPHSRDRGVPQLLGRQGGRGGQVRSTDLLETKHCCESKNKMHSRTKCNFYGSKWK